MKLNNRGFSLIELMVVIVIIGIIAGISAPNTSKLFQRNKLSANTSGVTSALYSARTKAVNAGALYGVRFFSSGEYYIVSNPTGTQVKFGPSHFLDYGISFLGNNFQNSTVVFNEYGQLTRNCLPQGTYTGFINLTDGSDTTNVTVTMITGRIREKNL